jgi:uncharacterized protein (TIGR02646 family)
VKRVRGLDRPTPGLQQFLDENPPDTSWNDFKNYQEYRNGDGRTAAGELLAKLAEDQHGLCAYCEIKLKQHDQQVEHFLTRAAHPESTYSAANLFAACQGGVNPHSTDPARRALRPSRRSMSCGQFKDSDHNRVGQPLKPTALPGQPAIFRVDRHGQITQDDDACRQAGVSVEHAGATLTALNLNCERLRVVRALIWEALEQQLARECDDQTADDAVARALRQQARVFLLPDENGDLPAFFTTYRAFFGDIGEAILGADAHWI